MSNTQHLRLATSRSWIMGSWSSLYLLPLLQRLDQQSLEDPRLIFYHHHNVYRCDCFIPFYLFLDSEDPKAVSSTQSSSHMVTIDYLFDFFRPLNQHFPFIDVTCQMVFAWRLTSGFLILYTVVLSFPSLFSYPPFFSTHVVVVYILCPFRKLSGVQKGLPRSLQYLWKLPQSFLPPGFCLRGT